MRVRVVKPFRDIHDHIVYMRGVELEVSAERFEEMNSGRNGVVTEAIEAVDESVAEPVKKPTTRRKKEADGSDSG